MTKMLSVVTVNKAGQQRHDLTGLRLPNGALAHSLDGSELFRELDALGVPDIDVNMGKQDLLLRYSQSLAKDISR
jgi:hypothetical protein